MFRTFAFGILLGILGAGAAAYFLPAVDLHRERSLIEVRTNGGNFEEFRINVPRDRILVGQSGSERGIPVDLEWPSEPHLVGLQAELFKVRNRDDTVVGVASRLASTAEETGPFVEWVLHLPARGSVYAQMELSTTADGFRDGQVRAGTRNFESLSGTMKEQFVAAEDADDGSQGRIQLHVALVAPLEELDELGDEE